MAVPIRPPISGASSASSTSCARSRSRRCTTAARKPWKATISSTRCSRTSSAIPSSGSRRCGARVRVPRQHGGVADADAADATGSSSTGRTRSCSTTPRRRRCSRACAAAGDAAATTPCRQGVDAGDGARRGAERQRPRAARARRASRRCRGSGSRSAGRRRTPTAATTRDRSPLRARRAEQGAARPRVPRRRRQARRARRRAPAGVDVVLVHRPRLPTVSTPPTTARGDAHRRSDVGSTPTGGCDVRRRRFPAVGC